MLLTLGILEKFRTKIHETVRKEGGSSEFVRNAVKLSDTQ